MVDFAAPTKARLTLTNRMCSNGDVCIASAVSLQQVSIVLQASHHTINIISTVTVACCHSLHGKQIQGFAELCYYSTTSCVRPEMHRQKSNLGRQSALKSCTQQWPRLQQHQAAGCSVPGKQDQTLDALHIEHIWQLTNDSPCGTRPALKE